MEPRNDTLNPAQGRRRRMAEKEAALLVIGLAISDSAASRRDRAASDFLAGTEKKRSKVVAYRSRTREVNESSRVARS